MIVANWKIKKLNALSIRDLPCQYLVWFWILAKLCKKTKKKNILMVVTFLCSRLRVKLVKKNKQIPLRLLLAVEQKWYKKTSYSHLSDIKSKKKRKIPSAFFSKTTKIILILSFLHFLKCFASHFPFGVLLKKLETNPLKINRYI